MRLAWAEFYNVAYADGAGRRSLRQAAPATSLKEGGKWGEDGLGGEGAADKDKMARFVSRAKRPMEKSKLISKKIGINFKQKGVDFCADNRHNVNTI